MSMSEDVERLALIRDSTRKFGVSILTDELATAELTIEEFEWLTATLPARIAALERVAGAAKAYVAIWEDAVDSGLDELDALRAALAELEAL